MTKTKKKRKRKICSLSLTHTLSSSVTLTHTHTLSSVSHSQTLTHRHTHRHTLTLPLSLFSLYVRMYRVLSRHSRSFVLHSLLFFVALRNTYTLIIYLSLFLCIYRSIKNSSYLLLFPASLRKIN